LGADQLIRAHSVGAEDVAHLRVETFHETLRLGVKLPTTTEEAQFNLAWPLAACIIDGEIGPDQILEQAFERADIRDLAERIEVVETDGLQRHPGRDNLGV
jgi:2-methylcitrate dehydratase PrpD